MSSWVVNDGGIYEVRVRGRINNAADLVNVFQVKLLSGGPVDALDFGADLVDYFTQLYGYILPICNAVTVINDLIFSGLAGVNVAGPFSMSDIDGDLTNNPVPFGVAGLISFPTGIKRVIMKKYWGVFDDSMLDASGNWSSTAVSAMATAAAHMAQPRTYNGRSIEYGYYSPKVSAWVPAEGWNIKTLPAYQTRRRPGTGS